MTPQCKSAIYEDLNILHFVYSRPARHRKRFVLHSANNLEVSPGHTISCFIFVRPALHLCFTPSILPPWRKRYRWLLSMLAASSATSNFLCAVSALTPSPQRRTNYAVLIFFAFYFFSLVDGISPNT